MLIFINILNLFFTMTKEDKFSYEKEVLEFWKEKDIYNKIQKKNQYH